MDTTIQGVYSGPVAGTIRSMADAPTLRTYRVRFTSTQFTPVGDPQFPYAPTKLTPYGILYTAIIQSDEGPRYQLQAAFNDAMIHSIEENGDFLEGDILAGHNIAGYIPDLTPPRSFWRRILGLR